MTNSKIDAKNGAYILEEEVEKVHKEGHNLWKDYFERVEGASKKEAKDLSTKAQKILSVAPPSNGLSPERRYLLD